MDSVNRDIDNVMQVNKPKKERRMKLWQIIKQQVFRFTCSQEGNFSLTITGASIGGLGAIILGFPATLTVAAASAGVEINFVLPVTVATAAKWLIGIGAWMAIIGGRNAISKNGIINDKNPNRNVR